MIFKSRSVQFFRVAIVLAFLVASPPLLSGNKPPAGQMCSQGAYVIGFDSERNIICSDAHRSEAMGVDKAGEMEISDSGSVSNRSEPVDVDANDADVEIAAKSVPATNIPTHPVTVSSVPDLEIFEVKPTTVVFGTSELEITVVGTGFHAESVIIFEGSTYPATVNQAGTRLEATVAIGYLSIGPYAVTVSNGSGMKAIRKKALKIY